MSLSNIKAFVKIAKHTIVKHSPEILMGVGAVSFVATIVAASKETIKEQDILEDHQEALDYIEDAYTDPSNDEEFALDEKAYKKSRREVYFVTTKSTIINYIPATALGIVSLASFFGAFGIMSKRYATLVVTYTALEESFRKYRERVIADKGTEADLYYLTGAKPKEITIKDEKGNKTKEKRIVLPDGALASPYAFKFSKYKENGERNWQWSEDSLMNRSYVLGQMDYANDQLYTRTVFNKNHDVKIRGWWFLNETRENLGEDANTAGAVVGNRLSNGEPGCNGYIDYGIVEATEIDPEDGKEIPCIIINPNVDGLIYDLVGKAEETPFSLKYDAWGEAIDAF